MPWLFSYGSLQQPAVQVATFDRLLDGQTDDLPGYTTATVSANGREHADAIRRDGSSLAGTAFEVTDEELRRADSYEAPDGYGRREVTLQSGRRAWVYTFRRVHVRAAVDSDLAPLTRIWDQGWHDAHDALVPDALIALRTADSLRERLGAELHAVLVVVAADTPVGFAMLRGSEVFQFYVDRAARGTGAAARLMREAEAHLAASGVETAWLACAVGNTRAARFYEKCGWTRTATVVIDSETSNGVFPIQVWRYEKRVR